MLWSDNKGVLSGGCFSSSLTTFLVGTKAKLGASRDICTDPACSTGIDAGCTAAGCTTTAICAGAACAATDAGAACTAAEAETAGVRLP